MIGLMILAASVASQPPSSAGPPALAEAAHAIEAGRIEQARLMIARAIGAGAAGPPVERLLADLAFASGHFDEALTRYKHLAAASPGGEVCLKGAIAALRLGRAAEAGPLADCAVARSGRSWQAWNARAVLADLDEDWTRADSCYRRALALAPGEAGIVNNQGWSLLLRGDWADALPLFERAAKLDSQSLRIANNLELARAALASELPGRRAGESALGWAARLNDAGVAARLLGEDQRALAAFTQALEASPSWYERAANNLEAMGKK